MKRFVLPVVLLAVIGGIVWYFQPSKNPDPNHTHADFLVFMEGEPVDFAKNEYMSGSSTGSLMDDDHLKHDPYFHLHDGNGNVIHRHKPGLAIGRFFQSIGFTMTKDCFTQPDSKPVCNEGAKRWQMFVNGTERPFDPEFIFADQDKLLFTYGASRAAIQRELGALSDDACLYSQTCRWRGKPPVENCIADPAVPCTE